MKLFNLKFNRAFIVQLLCFVLLVSCGGDDENTSEDVGINIPTSELETTITTFTTSESNKSDLEAIKAQIAENEGEKLVALTPEEVEKQSNALILTVENKKHKDMETLLIAGINPNYRHSSGWTALTLAVHLGGRIEFVKTLVKYGASLDLTSGDRDWTPLMYATNSGYIGVVNFLLNKAVNPNYQSKKGAWTALMLVAKNKTATQLLRETSTDILNRLLTFADPNLQNSEGWTALHWLVRGRPYRFTSTLKNFLNKGADPNIQNNAGWTALMYAIVDGQEPTEILITESKVEIQADLKNSDGNTALHLAAKIKGNRTAEAKLLISAGADPHIKNNEGKTALDLLDDKPLFNRGNLRNVLKKAMNNKEQ